MIGPLTAIFPLVPANPSDNTLRVCMGVRMRVGSSLTVSVEKNWSEKNES